MRQAFTPSECLSSFRIYARLGSFAIAILGAAFCSLNAIAAEPVKNLVFITLDGLRGEELFTGADKRLMTEEHGVKKVDRLEAAYWREDAIERRKILMPFLWEQFENGNGWVAGDIEQESIVVIKNGHYFSYPGYNELLTGNPDPEVNSNDKKYNQHVTFLEWLNRKPAYAGKVAAFCSWDVFPFIINDQRSGIPVNAGWQKFTVGPPEVIQSLNLISERIHREWDGVRYDSITMAGALEYVKQEKPRVLFISLGETDDWAHSGRYDRYLDAAKQDDSLIRLLWETLQGMPEYQGNTAFLLSCDHGRGLVRDGWKSHGTKHPGSERTWAAAFGPGLAQHGIHKHGEFSQSQIPATACAFLGERFTLPEGDAPAPLPVAPGL